MLAEVEVIYYFKYFLIIRTYLKDLSHSNVISNHPCTSPLFSDSIIRTLKLSVFGLKQSYVR